MAFVSRLGVPCRQGLGVIIKLTGMVYNTSKIRAVEGHFTLLLPYTRETNPSTTAKTILLITTEKENLKKFLKIISLPFNV